MKGRIKRANMRLIERELKTRIGRVECSLESDSTYLQVMSHNNYTNGNSDFYQTTSHKIELVDFKIRQPLYNGDVVEGSQGWLWRIEKYNTQKESLRLYCQFLKQDIKTGFESEPGEHLDSVSIWDIKKTVKLNIGTEDGEIMQARATNNDWLPSRFEKSLDFSSSFTAYIDYGFKTTIPDLQLGEKICFQFLVAVDAYSEVKVSTWLAVDLTKREVENWVGIW